MEAGEWDAYEKGHPAGAGCKRHLVTIRIGYPNKTINEIALVYHGKSDESKNFKVGFNAAVALMTNLLGKDMLPMILLESTVSCHRVYRDECSYKLFFLTEADVSRVFKRAPSNFACAGLLQ